MRDPATLPKYPAVILMWCGGSDTAHIAAQLVMPEFLVARCVDKYLDTKWKAATHYRADWTAVDKTIQAGAYDA